MTILFSIAAALATKPVVDPRDVAIGVELAHNTTLRADGVRVQLALGLEMSPVLCAGSPHAPAVETASLDPASTPGSLAWATHAAIVEAGPAVQRVVVAPLPHGGARVAVTAILAEDCATWLPHASPLDAPVSVPPGTWTGRELLRQVDADWASAGTGRVADILFRFAHVEVTLEPGMTLREAIEAFREVVWAAGGDLSWAWTIKDFPSIEDPSRTTRLSTLAVRAWERDPRP